MNENLKIEKIFAIPNVMSFIRILLVPVFAWTYFANFEYHYYYAGITLLVSGFTDMLDGFVARKCGMITNFGKFIDPVADKLTQGVVVACLAIKHPQLVPLLILFFAKEFSMLLGAVRLFNMGLRPSESKWWGKLSTIIIYALFITVLISDIISSFPLEIIYIFTVLSAICILFSLFNYYPIFKEIQSGEYDIDKEELKKNSNKK